MADYDDFTRTMTRGDTHRFNFTVQIKDSLGNTVTQNITSWQKFWITAKRRIRDLDADAVFALTDLAGGGIVRLAPQTNGKCEITITPTHTANIVPSRRDTTLFLDIQGKDGNGDIWTLAKGRLVIEGDVTRTTN